MPPTVCATNFDAPAWYKKEMTRITSAIEDVDGEPALQALH